MNPSDPADAPGLGPDFAARVLREVDAVRAGRRRMMAAAVLVSVAVLFGALVAGMDMQRSPETVRTKSDVARATTSAADVSAPGGQSEALEYLFPDAAPLAQFDRRYTAAMSGIRVDDQSQDSEGDYADAL